MTNMNWTFVSNLNEDEPQWVLIDDGLSVGHLLGPEHLAKAVVEGLNLLDASRNKGLITAMQTMEFDIVFEPAMPKSRAKAPGAPSKRRAK